MKEIVKYVRFYNRHIRVSKYIILISVINQINQINRINQIRFSSTFVRKKII